MPDDPKPVVTGGADDGGTGGTPVTPAAAESVDTGEMVEKARFDGLMSTFNRTQEELRRKTAELEALKHPATPPVPVAPAVPEEYKTGLDEVRRGLGTVLDSVRRTRVEELLREFPNAVAEDASGVTPEEWRASLEASHNRVTAKLDEAMAKRVVEERRRLHEEFGIPFDHDGGGSTTSESEELKQAREKMDPEAYARAILGAGPRIPQ